MAATNMYCWHGCGSQNVNGKFIAGTAANTTPNACPNNDGNCHFMVPIGTAPPGMILYICF